MNSIETLIDQLCPNGVEFKEMGEVAYFRRGSFPQPYGERRWYDGENAMPFVQVADVGKNMLLVDNTKQKISKLAQPKSVFVHAGTVIVTLQGSIGRVAVTQYDSYVDRTLAIFEKFKIEINKKFFAYQLERKFGIEKEYARGSTLKTITKEEFTKFQIPIPPLPIQQEIVTILDKFTSLQAELQAELQARRAQYEYYRNQLFSFEGKDVEWRMLGEIGEFIRGKRFVKNDIVAEGIPCIHYGEMYTHYNIWAKKSKSFLEPALAAKLRVAQPGDVIIVAAGETAEDIGKGVAWLGESNVVIHDACFAFTHNLEPKYVSFFLQTDLFHSQIKRNISSGKISSINASGLSKATIPIPSIEVQQEIVRILDKFNTLVTDLSVGLPAEIESRRKQYEYYRGKLLEFEPFKND
jgi:type I restriction enzyme S subunit